MTSRRGWAGVVLLGLLVAPLTACTGEDEAAPATSTVEQPAGAAGGGTAPRADPGADGADPTEPSETSPAQETASPRTSVSSGPEPTAAPGTDPPATGSAEPPPPSAADATQEDEPSLQPRPTADLSDEEIRVVYDDDAAPGEAVTATLCNLTRDHLELVESQVSGADGLDAATLRLALISLGDDLSVWEGLTWHLPGSADDIRSAQDVYSRWEFALALLESGDPVRAQEEFDVAARTIDALPDDPGVEVGCG